MIGYIIIALILLLLCWILFVPVMVRINTQTGHLGITLPGIFNVYLVPGDERFRIRIRVFFIPFKIDPFKPGKDRRKRKKNPAKKNQQWLSRMGNGKQFMKVTRAIWIRKLDMDMDTDDVMLNAWLVPAFTVVNANTRLNMQVNFEGNLYLDLDVRTRLSMLLWILLTNRS